MAPTPTVTGDDRWVRSEGDGTDVALSVARPGASVADLMRETVRARGHDEVRAEHASTFEVTTDDWLTPAGDCILAVDADRSPAAFDPAFVAACRDAAAEITARIAVGDRVQAVTGRGHPDLTFESDRSAVARTSDYVDDRTVMVDADRAARGIDRSIVGALREGADLVLTLEVEPRG